MNTTDITTTAVHLQHMADSLSHKVDWLVMDATAIGDDDAVQALDDLRMAALAHGLVVTEFVSCVEETLGHDTDTATVTATLDGLLDCLEKTRIAFADHRRSRKPMPFAHAFHRFRRRLEALLDAERELFTTCGSFVFPSEVW